MIKREAGPAQAALVPLFGGLDKKPRPLERDVISVGRARGCDIILEAPDVSTLHCLIYRTPEGFRIRDCGSRTGTRVNGGPVRNQLLADEDVLHLGPFSFQLHLPERRGKAAPRGRDQERLERSRRNLAQLALRFRGRCRDLTTGPGADQRADLRYREAELKGRIRAYDARANQLEEAERDLEQERAALHKEKEAHERHVLGRGREEMNREREEVLQMREQWAVEQAEAGAFFERQRQALSEAEAALKEQRLELGRMMGDLRELQQTIRRQQQVDVPGLQQENEQLRQMVAQGHEKASMLEEKEAQPSEDPLPRKELQGQAAALEDLKAHRGELEEVRDQAIRARQENEQLKKVVGDKDRMLTERDKQFSELQRRLERTGTAASEAVDLETYEAELNRYRQLLDTDRARLTGEMDQLRQRNVELDEATREMEMGMSRERAELGRERMRLERLREEVRAEMERMQREAGVRESLAPVQKLRDEMNAKKGVGGGDKGLNDRLKSLRNQLQE